MKLFANEVNNNFFRQFEQYAEQSHKIEAAVAYITDETIFKIARAKDIPIRIWCRIDEEVHQKTLSILKYYASYPKCTIYATDDYLHAKVIWFHGVGCYVGSANLTDKALHNNIEIGIFIEESPVNDHFFEDIKAFFDCLADYTSVLSRSDLSRIDDVFRQMLDSNIVRTAENKLREAKSPYLADWKKLRTSLFGNQKKPLYKRTEKSRSEHRFMKEWKETCNLLIQWKGIYQKEFKRPVWVQSEKVSVFSELDKMFDWYYESIRNPHVKIENIIQERYSLNKGKGEVNIRELFTKWCGITIPPNYVLESFRDRVPTQFRLLAKNKINHLTDDELAKVVFHCYALMDHIDQFISKSELGYDGVNERIPRTDKAIAYAQRFLKSPNSHGHKFLEVLNFFIWNESSPIEERLWRCTDSSSEWKYPGIDKSTLGELIGLARPEEYPVRNNRISRVLAALGFEVDWV